MRFKKFLCTFLAVVMLLCTMPLTAFAAKPSANGYVDTYGYSQSFELAKGLKKTLCITQTQELEDEDVLLWYSVDENVATVSDGVVYAKNVGTTTVGAICQNENHIEKHFIEYSVTVTKRKTGDYLPTKKLSIVSDKTAKYTYTQMEKDLAKLNKTYPDLMTYASLGKTADNRDIYEVQIGNPDAQRHIMIQATMHAREYINSLLAMRQIESLLQNYYTATYCSKYYSEIFDSVCVHVIPMLNPDGVTISQFGTKKIKDKTLKANLEKMCKKYGNGKQSYFTRWKANARGVDLNINFPIKWKKRKNKPSHPAQHSYKGPKAVSENESKIITKRIEKIKPKCVLSYHSTGSIIYWNFGRTGKLQNDSKSLFQMANKLTKYPDGEPNAKSGDKALGPNFGSWVCGSQNIPTLTIENGSGECPISIKEFEKIWNKNKYMIPATGLWTLMPAKVNSVSAKVQKNNTAQISWSKVSCDGYLIQYSSTSNFKNYKEIKIKENKNSYKTDMLKNKKAVYVRIKAYKKVEGKTYYSYKSPMIQIKRK